MSDQTTPAVDSLTGDYTIDTSHSQVQFIARHAMVTKVRGHFEDWSGTAHIDEDNPANSTVSVTINPASVKTGSADRDGHLTSADFFDVEKFPEWTFTSTEVKRDGEDWEVTGDFTVKGETRSITIEFEFEGSAKDPFGNIRVGFEGDTTVNRKDFGLTWNAALETGGVLVSDRIKLEFDISAIKTA
ncbi:MAG: YceI family protein [Nocardioidaceae bacterium]|nr:YceI family protein [Nocardioidaceae bacterium]